MGKITLKHYLDKRLKSRHESKNEISVKGSDGYYYPLYVQIICKRQNTKFKSFIKPSRNNTDFGVFEIGRSIDHPGNKKLGRLIEQEKKRIHTVVSLLKPFENDKFSLAGFSSVYKRSIVEVKHLVSDHCRQEFEQVISNSKFKSLTDVIDWKLTYESIKLGLDGMLRFIAKRNKQKFVNQIDRIDKVFTSFGAYMGKKRITLSQWIAEGHEQKMEQFLLQNKIKEHNKITAEIQKIIQRNSSDFK